MPFQSRRQQRWAFATGQPFAKRWAKATPNFAALPEKKDAGVEAGAMLHGPGGLMATPGMRKWGKRRPRVTTKPMTRSESARVAALARWGKYTPRPDAPIARGIALSKQPKSTHQAAPKPPRAARHARGGGKKGDQQRQQEPEAKRVQREQQRQVQHDVNKKKVYAQLNIAPDGQAALEALRKGEQPDAAALARGGFVAAGLVEQAADGSYRMTPSGRALMAAAESGDAGRAADITSAARDRFGARQARQAAAEARKQQIATRRAALASRRGGGGSKKKPAPGLSATAQRGIDRTRRHLADAFARARRQTTKSQPTWQKAMFAKMGKGGGGGGGGGGGASGAAANAPTLWNKNPQTGKRDPQMGLEHENLFGASYAKRQQELQAAGGIEAMLNKPMKGREQFFREQTSTTPSVAPKPKITPQAAPAAAPSAAHGLSKPERYQEIEGLTERTRMPQAGWNAPMSDKQSGYLGSLLSRARLNTKENGETRALADELISAAKSGKLTKWEASKLIDAMQGSKPFSTLLEQARNGVRDGNSEAPWRALLALPSVRTALINHTLNREASAEGLPF